VAQSGWPRGGRRSIEKRASGEFRMQRALRPRLHTGIGSVHCYSGNGSVSGVTAESIARDEPELFKILIYQNLEIKG
jgi:hypothetical protein